MPPKLRTPTPKLEPEPEPEPEPTKSKNPKEERNPEWPSGLIRRNDWFQFRLMRNGHRVSKVLKTKNVNVAIRLAMSILERIENQQIPLTAAVAETKVTFSTMANAYLQSRQLRPRSVKAYTIILRHFVRVFKELLSQSEPLLKDVTADLVARYVHIRRSEKVSRNGHKNTRKTLQGASFATVLEEVNLINSVLKLGVEKKILTVAPDLLPIIRDLSNQRNTKDVARPLSEADCRKLINAAHTYDEQQAGKWPYPTYFHALLSAFLYTGLRIDEMKHLAWNAIDLEDQAIYIRQNTIKFTRTLKLNVNAHSILTSLIKDCRGADVVFPKQTQLLEALSTELRFHDLDALGTLQARHVNLVAQTISLNESIRWQPKGIDGQVLIHKDLQVILTGLWGKSSSPFVFPHPDGGPWRFHLDRKLHEICAIAGITEVPRVHDLRHTVGATLRRNGVPLETIKELLRHASIDDTLRYAKYEVSEGRAAISKLPSWGK